MRILFDQGTPVAIRRFPFLSGIPSERRGRRAGLLTRMEWLDLIRSKTPGERIDMAFALTDLALQMAESGVRARHPHASEREIFLRAAALRIPRDLMIRAYGWDPEDAVAA